MYRTRNPNPERRRNRAQHQCQLLDVVFSKEKYIGPPDSVMPRYCQACLRVIADLDTPLQDINAIP